jgi:hypothetical protein
MADLGKFGVPLDGSKFGILHPKQSYRFRVVFKNFGSNSKFREMTQNIVTCTRPTLSHESIALHSYNSTGYIAGKHTWDSIELTMRDDITNAVVSEVGAQLQKQVNHYEQTSAVAGINYKFGLEIHSLDGTNNEEIESWQLDGCYIENVQYPQGDYSNSEANVVTATIRYDNATQIAGPNTNDGTTVGGDPFVDNPSPTGGTTFA